MRQAERRKDYGDGRVFQRGKRGTWYCRFSINGKAFTERCVTEGGRPVETPAQAEIFLKRKLNEAGAGTFIPPQVRNLRVQELWDSFKQEYAQIPATERGGRRLAEAQPQWQRHLAPSFGGCKIEQVTYDSILNYRKKRLDAGARPATVNREVMLLHRVFVLAKRAGKVRELPSFPERLTEDNTREGFVEEKQFQAILGAAQELWLRTLLLTMYCDGNRRSELIPTRRHPERGLRVKQVELHNGLIRLNTKTKNGKARMLPITFDMKPLLTACAFGKDPNDYVFTLANGHPVQEDDLRTAWKRLTKMLGLGRNIEQVTGEGDSKRTFRVWRPSLHIHDFRRSAARNFDRNGVPRVVAMQIGGWRTGSVYDRYNIVSESDVLEAGRRIAPKPVAAEDAVQNAPALKRMEAN
jgi:hypothetical protein